MSKQEIALCSFWGAENIKAAQIPKFLKENTYILCIMTSHVFLCAYYNNREYKSWNNKENWKRGESRNRKINPTKKKAHIHGLSSHIYCVLINLMANDKNADVYIPL